MYRTVGPILVAWMALACTVWAQNPPGKKIFEDRCGTCHGADGNGGEHAPAITRAAPDLQDPQLTTLIREGLPARGMPAVERQRRGTAAVDRLRPDAPAARRIPAIPQELRDDQRQIAGRPGGQRRIRKTRKCAPTTTGSTCCGGRTRANSAKSLPRSIGPPTTETSAAIATRHCDRSTRSNVKRVAPKWIFRIPNAGRLQGTPVVADGVMYVTQANECYALDAGNGRQIWRYQRPRSSGLAGDAASGINRGVALARRQAVHGHRQRPHDRAESRDGPAGMGCRDGGLAPESRRHVGSARRGQPGDFRNGRWRQRRERFCRRLRSGNRKRGLAFLDLAQAGRTGVGDVERHEHRAWRRATPGSPARTIRTPTRCSGRRAIPDRTTTATSAAATTCIPTASSRSIQPAAG